MGYNKGMNNDIVQLTDKNGNNVFPIAGAATQDSISKSMLEEGVFEGPELFPAPAEAYVRTNDIVDGAVTSDKIDWTTIGGQYAKFTQQNFHLDTAWTAKDIPNWTFTFDAVVGGIYLILMTTNYAEIGGAQVELDIGMRVSAGGTAIHAGNTIANLPNGTSRTCFGLVTATGTSVTIKGVANGGSTSNIRVDNGALVALRLS